MQLVIPESVLFLVPAGARLQLRFLKADSSWLVDQYLQQRKIGVGDFTDYVRHQLSDRLHDRFAYIEDPVERAEFMEDFGFNDVNLACARIEQTLKTILNGPTMRDLPEDATVKSVKPLAREPEHGTVIELLAAVPASST